MNIYEVLFPPNSEFPETVHFAVLTKDKKLKTIAYADLEHLQEQVKKIKIRKSLDYYLTCNTIKKYQKRNTENVLGLHSLVLDFDIHSAEPYEREQVLSTLIWRLKRDLFSIKPPFQIPKPVCLNLTGRGIQLWYALEPTSSRLEFLYRKAKEYLILIYEAFLSEYPELEKYIKIDKVASGNMCGLYRMFSTYNTKTETRTKMIRLHDKRIDLNTLIDKLSNNEVIQEHLQQKERQKAPKLNNDYVLTEYKTGYAALHLKRLEIIRQLAIEREDNIGERDIMLFLAYNSAKQCMPIEEAKKICREINNTFSEPLKDIEYLFKSDKVYKIKTETFCEWLNLDISTVKTSTPNLTRDIERKINKEEREQKKTVAVKMLKEGQTIKVVADKTGLSVSTISRLSALLPKTNKVKEWEKLGISKATYYRQKKKLNN